MKAITISEIQRPAFQNSRRGSCARRTRTSVSPISNATGNKQYRCRMIARELVMTKRLRDRLERVSSQRSQLWTLRRTNRAAGV